MLAPSRVASPFNSAPWQDVFACMERRFQWESRELERSNVDGGASEGGPQGPATELRLEFVDSDDFADGRVDQAAFAAALDSCGVVLAVGVSEAAALVLQRAVQQRRPAPAAFLVLDAPEVRHTPGITEARD